MNNKLKYENTLTAKLLMWCEYYAICNNALEAAKKAAFTSIHKERKRLLSNTIAMSYVKELRQEMIEAYTLLILYCILKYKLCIDMAINKNDYFNASTIILKLSKLKEPITNISGLVNIKIG